MTLRFLREAEEELAAASLYYERRQRGLGARFHAHVQEALQALSGDPSRFPCYEGGVTRRKYRRARVRRFPYIVVFEERGQEVLVVAVAHTSRRPGYWGRR
jgi:toxin ParE1/3/4